MDLAQNISTPGDQSRRNLWELDSHGKLKASGWLLLGGVDGRERASESLPTGRAGSGGWWVGSRRGRRRKRSGGSSTRRPPAGAAPRSPPARPPAAPTSSTSPPPPPSLSSSVAPWLACTAGFLPAALVIRSWSWRAKPSLNNGSNGSDRLIMIIN